MRLGNYLRVLPVLSLLALWHSSAVALDYYWLSTSNSYPSHQDIRTVRYDSASTACTATAANYNGGTPGWRVTSSAVSRATDTRYVCKLSLAYTTNGSTTTYNADIFRNGDACRVGTEYQPSTGACVPPSDPCKDKAGISEGFSKSGTAPDGFAFVASNGMFGTQRQGCKGGCATEISDVRLKGKVSGAYYARGSATYTGQQCSTTGAGDQIAEDTNQSTDPETVKEDKPCVYSSVGDKQVCESKKSEETEGRSCGTVNGVPTCLPTAPSKNGIDIRTESSTETHADGSSTTTKKDTASATKCKGVNNCTTTTATTTTTTKKDANGNTTSVGSTCTGSACPNRNTDPDGNGDGLGDCASGTKENCGSGVPGSGGGEGQDWYTPGEDTFASVLTQFSAAVKQTPIASQTTRFLTFNAQGSCPQWSISVWVFDVDIDQLCSGKIPWGAIKAVILAAAAFLAFRIALF